MSKYPRVTAFGLVLAAAAIPFTSPALACSDVSADGCPSVEEVDDNAATLTGFWIQSKVKLLWYGDDYAVAPTTTSATPTATATFFSTVDTEVDGDYSVYARWTTDPNRCTAARHMIYDGNTLLATVTVNQRQNGGAWRRLGTYQFTPNSTPRVVINNASCPAGTYVVADGIRWVLEDNDRNSIVDEPGVDYDSSNTAISLSGTSATMESVSVSAPRAGHVIAIGSGVCFASNSGVHGNCRCSITTGTTVDTAHLIVAEVSPANDSTWVPLSGARGFSVSAGSTTFRMVCNAGFGTGVQFLDPHITAMYSPTRY